jgi:Mg2+/Co2+ transporter CorB
VRDEIAGALQLSHSKVWSKRRPRPNFGALDLAARTVEEVMLHCKEIEMIDAALPVAEILRLCLTAITPACRHRDEPENIIGTLHAKDLLRVAPKNVMMGGLNRKNG